MWVNVIAAGLLGLLGVGVYQLWRGRLTATSGTNQLFADARFVTDESGVDGGVAASLAIAALELVVLVLTALVVGFIFAETALTPALKTLFGATFVVGAYLLGRGVYVRLGLPVSGRRSTDDAETVAELTDALAETVGDRTAEEFASIHEAMASARGTGHGPDIVSVALVAAARTDAGVSAVESWAASAGVASPATVATRRDELARAGVLAADRFALERPELADADPADLAAVTTTLLH